MHDISGALDTGLDQDTLEILVNLCDCGVNPEALAVVVKELDKRRQKREASSSGGESKTSNSQNMLS